MERVNLGNIMELKNKAISELKTIYKELYGSECPASNNKIYLWRKIAYKLQENQYGGLSAETQGKIEALIKQYDPVNNGALRPSGENRPNCARDKRLPIPGTVITKEYKGKDIAVKVLEKGFEYNNKQYKSLTAVAKEVTGAHWNGYLFFGL